MTPLEALKAYQRKSPPNMINEAVKFLTLSLDQRTELLFYMLSHQAQQLGAVSEAVGEDCDQMEPVQDN